MASSRTFTQQDMFQTYLSGQLPYGLEMDGRWTARFRLEARHPFLDRRIMEFAFAIPDNQRFRPGVSKFVLRNSMRGILPEKIRRRSDKSNLSELYPMAMIALGGERLFDRLNIVQSGWVDGVVLRRLYRSMAEAFSRAILPTRRISSNYGKSLRSNSGSAWSFSASASLSNT